MGNNLFKSTVGLKIIENWKIILTNEKNTKKQCLLDTQRAARVNEEDLVSTSDGSNQLTLVVQMFQ